MLARLARELLLIAALTTLLLAVAATAGLPGPPRADAAVEAETTVYKEQSPPPAHRRAYCPTSWMMISTRRFFWRPASVSFESTGCVSPKPTVVIVSGAMSDLAK